MAGSDSDSDKSSKSSRSSKSSSSSSSSSSEDVRRPPARKLSESSASSHSSAPRKNRSDSSSSASSSPPKRRYSSSSSSSSEEERRPAPANRSPSDSEEDKVGKAPKAPTSNEPEAPANPSPPSANNSYNASKVGSIRGIPLDLTPIKKMQEAEAKTDKIPNTLSRESSSVSSHSASSSSSPAVSPKNVVLEETKPAKDSLSRSSSSSSSSVPDKRAPVSRSSSSITSTRSSRSSRTRTRSPSRSRSRTPSRSRSPSSRTRSSRSTRTSTSPPRKNAKAARSSSSSYSRSRSRSRSATRSSRSSYSNNKKANKSHSFSESEDDSESVSTSSYSYSSASALSAEVSAVKKDRYPALREWYSDLPEPQDLMSLEVSDPYLNSVHANIDSLHHYVRSTVQHQEEELMDQYVYDLSKFDGAPSRKEDERRMKFLRDLERIRATRRQFRGMLFDAVRERNKAIESKAIQDKHDRELARKIDEMKPRRVVDAFTTLFFFFQVILVLFFVVFIDYSPASDEVILQNTASYYRFYSSIAFMLFVGYAFLGNFLKKNVYSTLSLVFMVGVLAIQWGMLWNYWWQTADRGSLIQLQLTIPDHINALYTAITCAISFAVIVGRASPLQAVVMVFFECFFYALNVFINVDKLKVVDAGGSIIIHTFGAFFGIFASVGLLRKSDSNVVDTLDKSPSYRFDVSSLFGTLFLWVLFPSFNAALLPLNQRPQAIVNTVFAIAASTTIASAVSHLRGLEKYKFKMEDIRNATLAGGIAVAASSGLIISPWAAILIGMSSGLIAVLCNWEFTPYLERKLGLKESRSVIMLHAVIGLVGAIISVFAAGGASVEAVPSWEEHFYSGKLADYIPRGTIQAGVQIAAIFITLGIASASGFVTGIFMWWLRDKKQNHIHPDEHSFATPDDY